MEVLIVLFFTLVGLAAALASLAIWAPRITRVRLSALLVAALLIPLGYLQFAELLSKPKPKSLEWFERNVEEAEILSVSLNEGVAIYMWLRLDGALEPRSYVLRWDIKLAERLQEDLVNAVNRNAKLVIKNPFARREGDDLGEVNIEIVPPPLMPFKTPRVPSRIFNPRKQEV